ncbi:MAG TPA: hypothetical protein VLB27_10810, partial [candidate division Zixibacteria bacterium]|nr:hypothetical protein [candidate division Zixibacteria bacterium]
QQPKEPKGDIQGFFAQLGVNWNSTEVFWDRYNPHPNLAHLPQEIVFIGAGNDAPQPFNEGFLASSGLQEIALLYPGILRKAPNSVVAFEPLLSSGPHSGMLSWHTLVQSSFFGMQINRNPRRLPDAFTYVPAAYVHGVVDTTAAGDGSSINLMVIADIDFISEQFFQIRDMGIESLNFDNITFFLNCMDILVGDSSFIDLRKKRVAHRTLATVEVQTSEFYERRLQEERTAEDDARQALAEAQTRLNEKVQELRQRDDLDEQTKQIMAQNLQEAENRRFEVVRANIESERDARIARSKENMELSIRSIQSRIKTLAVALPPTPALLFGVFIFMRRRKREQESVAEARMLRSK